MSAFFEELDFRSTPIGDISLRRRRDLASGADIFEIKLGEEFLMSSLFTTSEIELARLGLAPLEAVNAEGEGLDVVVGGLGLGYTAQAVLEREQVAGLLVVDALAPVISWHQNGLLPLGTSLSADPRCQFVLGDFFAMAASEAGFDPQQPNRKFDAVLVDIDHSPEALLNEGNASFYSPEGLAALATHLKPGGVFGLWSNERPDAAFTDRLAAVFAEAWAEEVAFHNPLQDNTFVQSVYLARTGRVGASGGR
jgi:spermidine synthase